MKYITTPLLALIMAGVAMPASAQNYFMRERITSLKRTTASTTTTPTPSATPTPTPTATPTPAPTPSYTYTPSYSGYGACSGGQQYASMASCRRSDSVSVALSFCTAAGYPSSMSNACSSVTYTAVDHGTGQCNADASHPNQKPRYWSCNGSDGSTGVFAGACGHNNPEWESC